MKRILSLLLAAALLSGSAFAADIDNPQTDASKLSTGTLSAARLPNAIAPSTSVTSPLHIGGSGTTGTQLTLQTTTGVGTTDAIAVTGGNNGGTTFGTWNGTGLALGSVAPDAPLTISGNATATVTPDAGTRLHLVGANATINRIEYDSFGSVNTLASRRADGTAASKTAVGAATNTFALGSQTWDGSAYATIGQIDILTVNAHTGSDHSSQIRFSTTPTGTFTVAFAAFVNSKGGISIGPTAVDVGASTLYLTPQTFASLPAAAAGNKGAMASVTDSTTIVWGATITGGGANPVMAWSNGTAWTVFGK